LSTFHAIVWIDHQQAHVAFFDRDHAQTQHIHSKSQHKHQGKSTDVGAFFADVSKSVKDCHEVLLTGPGLTRQHFTDWYKKTRQRIGQSDCRQRSQRTPHRRAIGGHGAPIL